MTVGGMGFIPERLLMMMMMMTTFKYLGSFVQNDVSQDKELNRRIGLATVV